MKVFIVMNVTLKMELSLSLLTCFGKGERSTSPDAQKDMVSFKRLEEDRYGTLKEDQGINEGKEQW